MNVRTLAVSDVTPMLDTKSDYLCLGEDQINICAGAGYFFIDIPPERDFNAVEIGGSVNIPYETPQQFHDEIADMVKDRATFDMLIIHENQQNLVNALEALKPLAQLKDKEITVTVLDHSLLWQVHPSLTRSKRTGTNGRTSRRQCDICRNQTTTICSSCEYLTDGGQLPICVKCIHAHVSKNHAECSNKIDNF